MILRIPDDFLRKYGGELSATATLSVPDGTVWHIGLKNADKKFWFLDGWPEFVQRYSVGVGYLLVFTYEGKSSFNVHIFNLATSEINYQSAIQTSTEGKYFINCLKFFEEMEDEDSVDFFDSPSRITSGSLQNKVFPGSVDIKPGKSNTPPALQNLFNGSKLNSINWGEGEDTLSSRGAGLLDSRFTRDIGLQFNEVEFKRSTEELKLRASVEEKVIKPVRKKRKSEGQKPSIEHEEETEMRNRFYESASARKRTVTAEERERAINAAKAFEPDNPFCRYLPSCFAEKQLNGVSGFIKLQNSDGRQWLVRCLYKGGRAKFSQGWFEFTLENNIGEGDVCVFELLRMKEVVLKVTIFRVVEDVGLSSPPLQQNQNVSPPKLTNTLLQHHLTPVKLARN
ncbi:hypothetical protein TanjilG_23487 [Lupinus angustifolius]|uniref:TF-B3 domain-containing protein n=1 Tax=Lupinus angustifolius TaxID=3871 RepID=A0A4P1R9N3_LUPAN|nr:hypothetical protein TanjilG_23487 [Lupinus angustifolius]